MGNGKYGAESRDISGKYEQDISEEKLQVRE